MAAAHVPVIQLGLILNMVNAIIAMQYSNYMQFPINNLHYFRVGTVLEKMERG